jgi:glycosyltransferase involved in cell wall biosynthesis
MNHPEVSIIIPCYNAEKWIEKTVSSALKQTYTNIEVIVVDNESKDKSYDIVSRILPSNNKLTLVTAENIYPYCWDEAREKGFSLSKGKYLFTLAADDLLHPEYIEKCLKYFNNGKIDIKILQSAIKGITENGTELQIQNYSYGSPSELKKELLKKCPVNSPTVIYERSLYDNGHLTTRPEEFSGAADYDLYCSLIDKGYYIYSTNKWVGYYYRWHKEQATWDMHKEPTNYDKLIKDKWGKIWNI